MGEPKLDNESKSGLRESKKRVVPPSESKSVWTSLEIGKLGVGFATPLMIAILTITMTGMNAEKDRKLQMDLRDEARHARIDAQLEAERLRTKAEEKAERDKVAESLEARLARDETFRREKSLRSEAFQRELALRAEANERDDEIREADLRRASDKNLLVSRTELWSNVQTEIGRIFQAANAIHDQVTSGREAPRNQIDIIISTSKNIELMLPRVFMLFGEPVSRKLIEFIAQAVVFSISPNQSNFSDLESRRRALAGAVMIQLLPTETTDELRNKAIRGIIFPSRLAPRP